MQCWDQWLQHTAIAMVQKKEVIFLLLMIVLLLNDITSNSNINSKFKLYHHSTTEPEIHHQDPTSITEITTSVYGSMLLCCRLIIKLICPSHTVHKAIHTNTTTPVMEQEPVEENKCHLIYITLLSTWWPTLQWTTYWLPNWKYRCVPQ